jgi:predicted enzyme related to lactoylglutathione lyase
LGSCSHFGFFRTLLGWGLPPLHKSALAETKVGWEIKKWDGPQDYWLITTGPDDEPGINGAVMRRQGEIDGQAVIAYVCTVEVSSVDEYVEKIVQESGSVALPKMAVPGVGWLAYCKDTEGNLFGLMAPDPGAK